MTSEYRVRQHLANIRLIQGLLYHVTSPQGVFGLGRESMHPIPLSSMNQNRVKRNASDDLK